MDGWMVIRLLTDMLYSLTVCTLGHWSLRFGITYRLSPTVMSHHKHFTGGLCACADVQVCVCAGSNQVTQLLILIED